MKNGLIIFIRNADPGKVKTRIAAILGEQSALWIYKKLLRHTKEITASLTADKYLFYVDEIKPNNLWSADFNARVQTNGDLGSKMENAFQQLFESGYNNVCIIGSDCYQLNTTIIEDAFKNLSNFDVVIGPASDGGYYLLGMKKLYVEIFTGKNWSSENLYAQTIDTLKQLNLNVFVLPELSDIDEAKDVPREWFSEINVGE